MTDASGDPSADPEQAADGDDLPMSIYRSASSGARPKG
jgi:hypothetical protein